MLKKCQNKLSDILFIGLLTYLSNGEDYEDMVLFARTHRDFLSEFISLENGIPSHDTFNRVFSMLSPDILRQCLESYGKDMVGLLTGKQICMDGKKLKGCNPRSKGNRGLYIVNAWVSEHRVCIGQKKVEDKSNEIEAIPALLEEIDISGAVVSIDAMGCQRDIADLIVSKEGHYLLALKENQGSLYEDALSGFKLNRFMDMEETWEYDHGRYETRKCSIIDADIALLEETRERWPHLKTMVRIEATRVADNKESKETRYYISDQSGCGAAYFNALTRVHWGIENHLHWHLDVTFGEDRSHARKGHSAENLSTMRKLGGLTDNKRPKGQVEFEKTKSSSGLRSKIPQRSHNVNFVRLLWLVLIFNISFQGYYSRLNFEKI